jgi:hypothetical protein
LSDVKSRAIIVVDFAYKGPKRKGRGTGHKGLRSTLKYLQYRNNRTEHLAQRPDNERWSDRGLGTHYRAIFDNCDHLRSKHVLAWTWVVSPAPDLMALVPEEKRAQLVCDLTERVVEDYYKERGFDLPEYSYVLHDRLTTPKEDGETPVQHLHTHVVLAGTVPSVAERLPVYNNKERGHDALFRQVASHHFAEMLDDVVGPDWRREREEPAHDPYDLDAWFARDDL